MNPHKIKVREMLILCDLDSYYVHSLHHNLLTVDTPVNAVKETDCVYKGDQWSINVDVRECICGGR